ncbi:GDP-L-fucose synthase family protein [Pseudonocardia oroxyli]|uniref:GDP-L-fucose synthase n=1 Tax=Pseudonocardia oroxyli TaxID=366584 RepID=A0A1G7ZA46_PSEOR|nr:GDP-L-fucose synthase [Pseudonocardia oroxyli]SDH05564.1 GDP-L-fucose synthase [Pseudonocardia oroxyli]
MSATPLSREATVYVAGHHGLVGSAIVRHLRAQGFTNVVGARSAEVDLRDPAAVQAWFEKVRPTVVVDAAARVGGILANSQSPVEFLSDNLRMQLNLIDTAHRFDVERLLFLGSSCIYPKFAEQPIREDSLLTGKLEETNDAYAVAKIAGITQVDAYRREYGRRWISAMPTNLYGPGDNFDLQKSHVLPALMSKFHTAAVEKHSQVVVWGTGTPRREFLHTDDLAAACLFLLEHYDEPGPINVGVGEDLEIREIAQIVADVTGFTGELVFDTSKPDGTPRKLLDISRLTGLGWKPTITISDGIRSTYDWYLANVAQA